MSIVRRRAGVIFLSLTVLALGALRHGSIASAAPLYFVIESRNDSLFGSYPPPPPSRRELYEFEVAESSHVEEIDIDSTHLRNLSIKLENLGSDLIRKPHLFGPHGWDFRSLEAIAESVTSDPELTETEKFIRVHEWMGLHFATVLGGSSSPYNDLDFSSNPLRNLNQYGHGMCGQSAYLVNALLRVVPPIGSMYGRNVKIGSHRVGEGFWDGLWHAFDATPGTGVVQWVFYKADNKTIPTWKYLISNPDLVSRIQPYTNATTSRYLPGATGETYGENRTFKAWDFNYDLRPGESITMYPEMRGRLDRTSARQDNSDLYRAYSDYGSAVFRYEPDFTNDTYAPYVRQTNVRRTSTGLVPVDPSKSSNVILEMKSTWCFAGADVEAWFRSGGKVYVGVRSSPYDTAYSSSGISWKLLSSGTKEYGTYSIEGKMAYWLKFVFEGEGSGLDRVVVSSEVQMSPWSMPKLEHGLNRIRFTAADMGSSDLRVTYEYDDESPFHHHEPATGDYGRHVPVRVGGILHRGAKLSSYDHGKGRFWDRLKDRPGVDITTKVEIYQITGSQAGQRVRTLVSRKLKPGWYNFFWDGTDDSGELLPRGMYSYKLSFDGKLCNGERLYLFEKLWPDSNPQSLALLAAAPERSEESPAPRLEEAQGPEAFAAEETSDPEVDLAAAPLSVEKLTAKLRLDVDRRAEPCFADSAFLRLVLPGAAAGWDPAGKTLRVNIGGAEAQFLLDRRGRGRSWNGEARLQPRRGRDGAEGGDVVARITLRGDWVNEWADEGVFPGENDSGSPIELGVRVELDGARFAALSEPYLVSRAGKAARLALEE